MDRRERPLRQCTRWFDILATRFPDLSRAETRTLALWSFAATITQHIGSTTCAGFLAQLFEQPLGNFRQRLREFYWGAEQKRGSGRCTLNVEMCFAPLLRWVLALRQSSSGSGSDSGSSGSGSSGSGSNSGSSGSGSNSGSSSGTLVLALDATLIRDRLAVLSVSVVFRGSAIPVAWAITRAGAQGSWVALCRRLFGSLAEAVPTRQKVLMLTDRGLESRRIFAAITDQGWHPMMRLTRRGTWHEAGTDRWQALAGLLSGPGRYDLGNGHLFKTDPFACTLLALWEEDHKEPWLLMTDLSPAQCQSQGMSAACYGLRSWIEQGFRCLKGGAYHYQRTRITDPARAERVWLVMAVSLVWTHALGGTSSGTPSGTPSGNTDADTADPSFEPTDSGLIGIFRVGVRRVLGVHRSGWVKLLVAALRGEDLPLPERLVHAPLPTVPPGLTLMSNLLGPNPPP
jgi:hypothetical protein